MSQSWITEVSMEVDAEVPKTQGPPIPPPPPADPAPPAPPGAASTYPAPAQSPAPAAPSFYQDPYSSFSQFGAVQQYPDPQVRFASVYLCLLCLKRTMAVGRGGRLVAGGNMYLRLGCDSRALLSTWQLLNHRVVSQRKYAGFSVERVVPRVLRLPSFVEKQLRPLQNELGRSLVESWRRLHNQQTRLLITASHLFRVLPLRSTRFPYTNAFPFE